MNRSPAPCSADWPLTSDTSPHANCAAHAVSGHDDLERRIRHNGITIVGISLAHVALRENNPDDGRVRLCVGNHTADILPSETGDHWFYVIQPVNSREIIAIDRCDTREEARDAAYKELTRLNDGPKLVPST